MASSTLTEDNVVEFAKELAKRLSSRYTATLDMLPSGKYRVIVLDNSGQNLPLAIYVGRVLEKGYKRGG